MGDRDLAEILESDDELPNCYDDDPEGRAYLDDHRFDAHSTDSSIDNGGNLDYYSSDENDEDCRGPTPPSPVEDLIDKPDQSDSAAEIEAGFPVRTATCTGEKLIKKGILSKQDIFCLKCVADLSTDSTLIWFIDFLIQKDMQNNYKFLKSCLVNEDIIDKPITMEKYVSAKSHHYVVVSR